MQAHRDYWKRVVLCEDQRKIPDLDVYTINVHPSKQHTIPAEDYDAVKDRINDITCPDSSSYDKMVGDLATDYTELIHNLKELAKRHFKNKDQTHTTFQDEIESILKAKKKKDEM